MRAKVASRAGGHVFEKRFLELEGFQLSLAYRQAIRDEKEHSDLIVAIHNNWVTRMEDSVKALLMFSNPSLYKSWEDLKKLQKHQEEISPEDFPQVWDELMQFLPEEVLVENMKGDPMANLPSLDPEVNEFLTGFVPYKERKKVNDDGNE